jgi:hypothetical protein
MNPALMPGRLSNSFDLTHASPVRFKQAGSRHLILVPDGRTDRTTYVRWLSERGSAVSILTIAWRAGTGTDVPKPDNSGFGTK